MTAGQLVAWITDPWTFIIVGVVAVLLFGKRLPEVGRSLGRGIAEFKRGLRDVQDELHREPPAEEPPSHRLREPQTPSRPADYAGPGEPRAGARPPEQVPPVSDVPPVGPGGSSEQEPK